MMGDFFDAHCHLGYIDGKLFTTEQLLQEMDKNGVAMAIVSSTDQTEHQSVEEGNSRVFEAVKKYPDRFVGFAYVDPTVMSGSVEELERSLQHGLTGVKLKPKAQGFSASDKLVHRVVEFCDEAHLPVFIHTGTVLMPFMDKVRSLADEFPATSFVVSHCSHNGYSDDAVAPCGNTKNLLFDTADTPPRNILETARSFGPERVVFGSGWPFCSLRFELAKVKALLTGFPDVAFQFTATVRRLVSQLQPACSMEGA